MRQFNCHCEPFALCHSERSEESLLVWLRVNSVKQSQDKPVSVITQDG
jgi:hypothetical protein